ncbi:MAG: hypothetical protein MUC44_01960, partial [Beijerinckiaceae bacterium]|nr:hypothetical protein [Beijerinckiaceae bacterium]
MFFDSGARTQVNVTAVANEQLLMDVVTAPNGTRYAAFATVPGFTVTPLGYDIPPTAAITLRAFDASGVPSGAEITLNLPASGFVGGVISYPRVVALDNGGFALAYSDAGTAGETAFRAQLYSATGTLSGSNILLATGPSGAEIDVRGIVVNPAGGFDVAMYTNTNNASSFSSIQTVSNSGVLGGLVTINATDPLQDIAYFGSVRAVGQVSGAFPYSVDFGTIGSPVVFNFISGANQIASDGVILRMTSATTAIAAVESMSFNGSAVVSRAVDIVSFTDGNANAALLFSITLPNGFVGRTQLQDFLILADGSFAVVLATYANATALPTLDLYHYTSAGVLDGFAQRLNPGNPAAGGVHLEQLADGRLMATYSGITTATGTDTEVFRELFTVGTASGVPTAGNDTLIGTSGNDVINALSGNDTIYSGLGSDTINGGAGNDLINPGDNPNTGDIIIGSSGNDTLIFEDAVTGSFDLDYRSMNVALTVTINGATGTVVKGGQGTDSLMGLDRILDSSGVSILGSSQADVFNLTPLNGTLGSFYQIRGGAGNDTITSGNTGFVRADYRDVAIGGIVADLSRTSGQVINDGYGTSDTFTGVDEISGTNNSDRIRGSINADNFILNAGAFDVLDGGAGFDRLRYDRSGVSGITVDLESGYAHGLWTVNSVTNGFFHAIRNIEHVRGTVGNDVLTGNATGETRFEGRGGADVFVYRGGTMTIKDFVTNAANNAPNRDGIVIQGTAALIDFADLVVDYSPTFATVTLSAGNTITLEGVTSGLTADDFIIVPAGTVTGLTNGGTGGNDSISGMNYVIADLGSGHDTLVGSAQDDTISGYDGNDSLSGGGGNDDIFGVAGSDWIDAGAGNDNVEGFSDNDTLIGGLGDDEMDGGRGADSLTGGDGRDELHGDRNVFGTGTFGTD